MRRPGAVGLLLVALAIPAFADEFGAVVKSIESRHGIHRTDPHMIGFALFLANPAMWGNTGDRFKVASFQNENDASKPSLQELDQIMLASLSPNWHPYLRLDSRKDGKTTVIYADLTGQNMRMLITSMERNDIGVVQMEIDDQAIKRLMANLKGGAKSAGAKPQAKPAAGPAATP